MKGRPRLSPPRLLAALVLPLAAYWLIRRVSGSTVGALAITQAVPAAWLAVIAVRRRRLEPVAVVSTLTVVLAFAAYLLTGGDPLALELRRAAVTGPLGLAALASIVVGRPLLLLAAEHAATLNPERRLEIQNRLAEPDRRRALTVLTAIIGLTLALDGASQVALALTVPTGAFFADATAARVAVLGTGMAVTVWYFRYQRDRRAAARR